MDLGLDGRVALVTASSKGLGRGAAEALAAEGASVVICARGGEALEATRAGIEAAGGAVLAIEADVTEQGAPDALVAATLERFGRIDIVVGNSGGPPPRRALEVTDEELRAALEANLLTHVRLTRAALPHLRAQGWGRLCFIASYSIVQPLPHLALSNAARTGLWAWAKTAAKDLVGSGVTLNLACPGPHGTDRMKEVGGAPPAGGFGDPGDFGRVVAFLCSTAAAFVNGAAVLVDGGETLAL
ncbi:MAG TPA: SDR family oxidoreductase [Acidimicrobiales bacterium]|nr:SDR family oxidoreductase [Acidimicrobiales bacterium]